MTAVSEPNMAKRRKTRRRPFDLTDTRAAIESTGEYGVGAFARKQRRKQIMVLSAGLALIIGAYVIYRMLSVAEPVQKTSGVPVFVRCINENCAFEGQIYADLDQANEYLCPECKQRACRKLWLCKQCDARFVRQNEGAEIRCPECGSYKVGTAAHISGPGSP